MNRALPLLDWAVSQPDKACIVTDEGAYTYRDVAALIRSTAATLADRVGYGTRVGLFIDSTPNFIIYEYAVFYLGGIVAPINRALKAAEVQGIVENLDLALVVSDGPLDIDGAAPVVTVTGEIPEVVEGIDIPPVAEIEPSDGALLLQTSGSTGRPKGVLLTVRNLSSNYDASYRWLGIGKEDRILLTLPVFNTYALNQGINMLAMTGATLRLLRRFTPEGVARALADIRPTFIPFVPTMVTRLYQAGILFEEPIKIGIGAAASPANIASDAWTVFPQATLYMGYGLTEATAITSVNHIGTASDNNGDFQSAGIIVPGQQVRLGGAGSDDERGSILIRGANVFAAYVGTTEPRPVEDGWLDTGDIGRFDENGRLHIVDR
ncbi:MAG: long-chain fatty acid--CoA ligase, partial [Microbacterium sp.]